MNNYVKNFKYIYIFKILGYDNDRYSDYDDLLDIEVTNNAIIPIHNEQSIKKCNICYMYNSLIFALISWKIFYTLWLAIISHDVNYGCIITFPILVISQYGIGIVYFNKYYFHSKMTNANIRHQYNIFLGISSTIGLILAIVFVVFLWNDIDTGPYSVLFTNQTIPIQSGISTLMFFDMLFSHQIIAINFTAFITNLVYDKKCILTMENDIINGVNSSFDTILKINKIAGVYKSTKEQFEKNISETEPMFEAFSILTFIHLGFLAYTVVNNSNSNNNMYITQLIYAGLYISIYILFLHIINTVNKVAGNIDQLIKKNLFLANFFQDNSTLYVESNPHLTTEQYLEEAITILYFNSRKIIDLNQKIVWKILRDEVKEEWATYTVMGFIKVDGTSIITKLLAVLVMIFFGSNFSDLFSI